MTQEGGEGPEATFCTTEDIYFTLYNILIIIFFTFLKSRGSTETKLEWLEVILSGQ